MEATLDHEAFASVADTLDSQQRTTFAKDVARLQELAANATDLSTFLRTFAERVSDLFAASAVAIWFPDPTNARKLTTPKVAVGYEHLRLDDESDTPHRALIEYAFQQSSPIAVHPFSRPGANGRVANPTDAFILLTAVTSQQTPLAVLEIALGPRPLRRPQQALVSQYVAWLAYLGQVLEQGLQNAFARTPAPQRLAAEVIHGAQLQADQARQQLRAKLQESLGALAGHNFGTLRDNQQIAKQVHALLESVALRVQCPECGEAAILRCQKAGNAKTGAFMYDHYLDAGRTFHGGQTTFPTLTLVPKPPRRTKK